MIIKETSLNKNNRIHLLTMWPYSLPLLGYLLIYVLLPIISVRLAFSALSYSSIFGGRWIGLGVFEKVFDLPDFGVVFINTLRIGSIRIILLFTVAIVLALLISKIRRSWLRKIVIAIFVFPTFISWVALASSIRLIFSWDGFIHNWTNINGDFLGNSLLFSIPFYTAIFVKEIGFFIILFLDAIERIDPFLIQAARCDGAREGRLAISIIIPLIWERMALVLLFLLLGFTSALFEPIMALSNPALRPTWDILESYSWRVGFAAGDSSIAMATILVNAILSLSVALIATLLFWRPANKSAEGFSDGTRTPLGGGVKIGSIVIIPVIFVALLPFLALIMDSIVSNPNIFYIPLIRSSFIFSAIQGLGGAILGTLLAYLFAAVISSKGRQLNGFAAFLFLSFLGMVNGGYIGTLIAANLTGIIDNPLALFVPISFNPLLAWYIAMEFFSLKVSYGDLFAMDGISCLRQPIELFRLSYQVFIMAACILYIQSWNNWFVAILLTNSQYLMTAPAVLRTFMMTDMSRQGLGITNSTFTRPSLSLLALAISIIPMCIGMILFMVPKRGRK
jgi:putative aldouronate transport system permease protein